eukprot:SM000157S02094  [mRNA]  locus=s157:259267:270139:- [translate_table: standard]
MRDRLEDVSPADVRFFREGLQQWHERDPGSREPAAWAPSAAGLRSRAGGRRSIAQQMSAPVGGSRGMLAAAAAHARVRGIGPQHGGQLRGPTSPDEKDLGDSISAADVAGLKEELEGAGKESLVELVLQYHRKLVELGHLAEAHQFHQSLQLAQELLKGSGKVDPKPQTKGLAGVDQLLRDGLLAFLLKLQPFLVPLPPQVVTFKNLTYTSRVRPPKEGFETVGSAVANCLFSCLQPKGLAQDFDVIKDCTGYLMPGTLTLVCGPPGCGKSTLHKSLSGRISMGKTLKQTGDIRYNGKSFDSFQVRRMAAMIGQTDKHLPTLTVRETLEFAQQCTELFKPEDHPPLADIAEMVSKSLDSAFVQDELGGKNLKMELTLHLLGLQRPADTRIGNHLRRGTYVVFYFDEISTGLDSSATYDIVSAIRTIARVRQTTCLLSLLQPAPEVFNLFDRLIVLNEGNIIYQGPRDDVLRYFANLGYVKPEHVDIADFLQEIPTPAGRQFLPQDQEPMTKEALVDAYLTSDLHRDVLRVVECSEIVRELWVAAQKPLGAQFADSAGGVVMERLDPVGTLTEADIQYTAQPTVGDRVTGATDSFGQLAYNPQTAADLTTQIQTSPEPIDSQTNAKFEQEFAQPWWPSTKTVLRRQFKVAIRNTIFFYARMAQVLILGVFTGTVFYQLSDSVVRSAMDLRKSVAFIACLAMALGSIAQIPNLIDERQVFIKQYAARFFRPGSYVLAGVLSQLPFSLCEIGIYAPLVYWLTGLSSAQGGVHFIMFLFIVFMVALVGSSLVRLIASISPSREAAGSLAGLSILAMLLFSGFLITKGKIPGWWIWMYYVSPLQWAYTAIVCNEFLSGSFHQPCREVVNVAAYCVGHEDLQVGQAYLKVYRLPATYFKGVWVSVMVLMAYYVVIVFFTFVTTAKVSFKEVKSPPAARLKQQAALQRTSMAATVDKVTSTVVNIERNLEAAMLGPLRQNHKDGGGGESMHAMESKEDATALTFHPVALSFHNLSYEVDIPGVKEPRLLLNSVSGYSLPGTMTALMGSSGAGKTTLLDVLAGRKTIGRTRGDVLVNGYPKVAETFARIRGYVEQNDIHTPFITVKESLDFSGALRLPRETSQQKRDAFVQQTMDLLELQPIANKLVGTVGEGGLSVEEAKRLTIGVELVANPSVLFLDEPTSGLDSRAAQIVVKGIQNIVQTGRSIICTIHQPSRRIFMAFDHLLLLKRGGEVAYFGPIGLNARDLLGYFEALPGMPKCGPDQNPATYMLEAIGAGIGHAAERDFALDYRESALAEQNEEELQKLRYGKGEYGPEPSLRGYAASWPLMLQVVIKRQYRTYWRNVQYSYGRMIFSLILGLLLGSAFWQISYTTQPGLASRSGLIYIAIVFVSIVNANNVIPQVNAERPVYYRENSSNMYSSFLYDFSWGLAETPYLAISILLFCSVCCSMAGVATDSVGNFFQFWFIFFEYAACITFFGIFLAMVTPNAETATIIIPVMVNIWNIMSGFMIPKNKIPSFWIWLYYLNPTQYALNSLTSIVFFCDTNSTACSLPGCATDPQACPACKCPRLHDSNNQFVWTYLKSYKSLEHQHIGLYMFVLFLFVVLFRVAAYLGLRYARYNRR